MPPSGPNIPAGAPRPRRAGRLLVALLLGAAATVGCGSKDAPPAATTSPGTPPPIYTGPGTPLDAPVGASMDANGGTLSSADGQLTMTVPPGAVPSGTTFSIEPITNVAIGAVGPAFRLRPEGVTLQKPVTLVFRAPDAYAAGTSIDGLGIATQDASGFWMVVPGVHRDPVAKTLTVEATHFSDWGVIWSSGIPTLYGSFSLTQTLGTIPFRTTGSATFFFQGESATRTLYVLTGATSPQFDPPVACSTSGPAERPLVPSLAEITNTPLQLRWALNASWDLVCTNPAPDTVPDPFVAPVFDTLGIAMAGHVCTRGYVGTPTLGTGGAHGTYLIDCGVEGSAQATWDFYACVPGVSCTDPALNACLLQAISCDTGQPVCTETTSPAADGTVCGAGGLDRCVSGACACVPGVPCPNQDACHTGAVACDGSGVASCAQTALPDGTFCGTSAVCSAGACKTLASIAVTPASPSVLAGLQQQFTATGTYSDASTQNLTALVVWASTNAAAATIDPAGLASTVAAGSTTISATLNGVTGSTTLTVLPTLTSIAVTPANPGVAAGVAQQFTATGTYSDGSTQNLTATVTWASTNGAAATIDPAGLASTVGVGTTTISATSGGVSGSTTLTVLPALLTSIAVTPANPSVAAGVAQQFTATGTYSDASTRNLTALVGWASTNAAAATIDPAGLASTVAAGGTTISATLDGVTGSTTLTVLPPVLSSIAVTPANPSVTLGGSQQFAATGTYSDGSTQNLTASVTWASTNGAAATIAAGGLASTVAAGTTTISASFAGVSGGTTLTVTPAILISIAVTPANPGVPAGLTQQFAATGTYSDGSTQDLTGQVAWTPVSDPVATVDPSGLATAWTVGSTEIFATLGAVSGSTTLTVLPPLLSSIAVTPANPTVTLGASQQFTAMGRFSDGSTQDLTAGVTWASTNGAAATIAAGGLASTVAAGGTTISATAGGVFGSTTLTVTPAVLTSIAVTPANPSVPLGLTQQLTATGTYSDLTTRDLTGQVSWTPVSDPAATVDPTGLVSTLAQGSTTVSATLDGVTGSTTLTVLPPVLSSIAVTPPNPSVAVGLTQQFAATGTYSDASTQDLTAQVTWASTVGATATIDAISGLATAVASGTTTISATFGGVSGSTTLTVP